MSGHGGKMGRNSAAWKSNQHYVNTEVKSAGPDAECRFPAITLLLHPPDSPGWPVHDQTLDDFLAFSAGDEVVFKSPRLIRRHVAEQVRPCRFWIDRTALRNCHGPIFLGKSPGMQVGLKRVNERVPAGGRHRGTVCV